MQLSHQQEECIKSAKQWFNSPDRKKFFRIDGYAGSGKTTIAKKIAEALGGVTKFAAFTGKAAHVLSRKGCAAQTIHKLIYLAKDKPKHALNTLREELGKHVKDSGKSPEELKQDLEYVKLTRAIEQEEQSIMQPAFGVNDSKLAPIHSADLVILDEVSMVNEKMATDILSFKKPVLILGDPAQLPPIKGTGYFMTGQPDVMLTEIHRQARDNPIIDLATRVRNGEKLEYGEYGESRVMKWMDVADQNFVLGHDQIIVGKNKTRHSLNDAIRRLKGFKGEYPVMGDRLICLRNNREYSLLNGSMWLVHANHGADEELNVLDITSEDDASEQQVVDAWSHIFRREERYMDYFDRKQAQEFDYGYAITCHKSQGSQWDSVLVKDESYSFRQDRSKWLYTAITRAAERVTIAR